MAECWRQTRRTGLCAPFFVVWLALWLAACGDPSPDSASLQGDTMGTTWHVTVVPGEGGGVPEGLRARIQSVLDDVDASMSTYRPESELSRLNAHPVGKPFSVSAPFMEVLVLSREVYRATDGAFDPTVGPLVDLWGFGPEPGPADGMPDPARIDALRERLGFDAVELDPAAGEVTRLRDVGIDLSAVAKGYAADRVAELLRDQGVDRYMVEIGGEMALAGRNPRGVPWQIAVERPESGERRVHRIIGVTDTGLATSGDYRNYFEHEGVRYSHTIDPRTGYPVRHGLVSVTVAEVSSGRADALATAFMVMGAREALTFAAEHDVAVLTLTRSEEGFDEAHSPAFEPYLPEEEE